MQRLFDRLAARLEALKQQAIEDGSGYEGFWAAFNREPWAGLTVDEIRRAAEAYVGTHPADTDWNSDRVRRRALLTRASGIIRDLVAELERTR